MNTIRKISVGLNYPDGALHYQIGKKQNLGGEIHEIKSIEKVVELGVISYKIIISGDDGSNVVWKEISNLPTVVEFLVDFE